jgi:hypothetical protein
MVIPLWRMDWVVLKEVRIEVICVIRLKELHVIMMYLLLRIGMFDVLLEVLLNLQRLILIEIRHGIVKAQHDLYERNSVIHVILLLIMFGLDEQQINVF